MLFESQQRQQPHQHGRVILFETNFVDLRTMTLLFAFIHSKTQFYVNNKEKSVIKNRINGKKNILCPVFISWMWTQFKRASKMIKYLTFKLNSNSLTSYSDSLGITSVLLVIVLSVCVYLIGFLRVQMPSAGKSLYFSFLLYLNDLKSFNS